MFYGCIELKSFTISDNVKTIGAYAFNGCTGLGSITLPDSVREVGDNSFCGCRLIKEIKLPEKLTYLGEAAFKGCSGLKTINIPRNIESLNGTFEDCSSLEEFECPEYIKSIGEYTFNNCTSLKKITIKDPDCNIADNFTAINNSYNFNKGKYSYTGDIIGYDKSTASGYAEKFKFNFVSLGERPDISGTDYGTAGYIEYNIDNIAYHVYSDHAEVANGSKFILDTLELPKTVKNKPLTVIGENAFENCRSIKKSLLMRSADAAE